MIAVGTQNYIGVAAPKQALLFVILSPVGPYFPGGFKPVALYGTTEYSRAAPGGACLRPINDRTLRIKFADRNWCV
jgi:branched-subunit amino acid aminotransferase/4-amino-4-deoxychorismate lyase